ncbi:response regulator [Bacillus sp. SM2101]|uniref:response regulator n=1 Tax=Bacillus sp. SM2101 TaxID=2805366 RepID=UPI001BDE4A5A|nr:response regulator [Bacillus sp. SM2101]
MSEIKVLIVEDDTRIAEINRRFTEKISNFIVCGIATNSEEAYELLEILHPDLVLLDVYFPGEDGMDLLWYIRRHYRNTDVIMITAAKEAAKVQDAIRGGAIDYIIKPIIFPRFKDTLEKYKVYKQQIENTIMFEQQDVDDLFRSIRKDDQQQLTPKGIDPLTLTKVLDEVGSYDKGITAEELGQDIGVSRTTARRYLEYLVSVDKVRADLTYGTVGRPERRYFTI